MAIITIALLALTERAAALRIPHTMSRRAAVGAAFSAAALPLAPCSATTTVEDGLAKDEDKLRREFDTLDAIDEKINSLRARAFSDEIKRAKDEEASLQALVQGDRSTAKRLADEASALQADERASDKIVLALREEETKELEVVSALEMKVKEDSAAIREKEAASLASAAADTQRAALAGTLTLSGL